MMRKGAIHLVPSQKGEFVNNLFLASKKDGGEPACGKSKEFERVSYISTLQNGGNLLSQSFATTGRLELQN